MKLTARITLLIFCLTFLLITTSCTFSESEKVQPTIRPERAEQMEYMLEVMKQQIAEKEQISEEKGRSFCDMCDIIPGYTGAYISIGDSHIKKCKRCGYIYSEPAPHNYMRSQGDMEIFIGYPFEGYYYYKLKYGDYRLYCRMCEDCRALEGAISREPMHILMGKVN